MEINTKYVLAVLAASVNSGFQHGYSYGIISVAHNQILDWFKDLKKSRFKKAPSDKDLQLIWSIAVSIFSVGGMIGSFMTAYFANRFGHKGGLIWNNCILFLALSFNYLSRYSNFFEVYIIGRFLMGVNSGLNSGLCVIYLSEIAPLSLRGSTTSFYTFIFSVSILLSQALHLAQKSEIVANLIFVGILSIGVIQLILLLKCPESPRFLLITLDDQERAEKALEWFRNKKDNQIELNRLLEHKRILKQLPPASMKKMFTDSVYRTPLIIAIAASVCQQGCGIEAALNFSSKILEEVGLSKEEAQYSIIAMSSLTLIITFFAVLLIDAVGRRPLFLISLCGMAVDSLFVTVVFLLASDEIVREQVKYAAAGGVVLFGAWFSLGTGIVPVVVTVELFDHLARPFAVSIVVPCRWLARFLVSVTYSPMAAKLGFYVFGIYCFIDLISFIFINMYLPETKGKSSKEIIKLFYDLKLDYNVNVVPSTF